MRPTLLAATAALALSACNQTTPGDAAASGVSSAPATMASTNAKVEPVPGSPASAAPASSAPSPTPTGTAMPKAPAPSPTASDPLDCGAGKAARFVGKIASPDVRAQVIETVGHNRIRWIGPTDSVTMDYSEERLNADLSAANRITGCRCG